MPGSSADRNPVEVLAEEFLDRRRRGERPSLPEYLGRYPELADEIRELFPLMLDMEDVRPAAGEPTGSLAAPAAPLAGPAPRRLGDYRLLRELGRGGMGVVYEAEQETLGRPVALKVLLPSLVTPQQVRRFGREARAAGRLHHTNIVPVFGVGEQGGTHYYVMQFIPGQPLDEVLREIRRLKDGGDVPTRGGRDGDGDGDGAGRPSAADVAQSLWGGRPAATAGPDAAASGPPDVEAAGPGAPAPTATAADGLRVASRRAPAPPGSNPLTAPSESSQAYRAYARSVARVGVQVAEALEYAAGQGVVHRDVKPSNLLLDTRGTAWVTDFGLAKSAGQDDLTRTGDLVGTLRYMPPERFRGEADRRSDVYSLGLTLYELLALRPAFDEADRGRLIAQITGAEPPRLRRLDPGIPGDLATVVHKAMAREPADRYQTAGELAADLARFLEDRPIRARRPRRREVAWRWCRRNPAIAALLGLVTLLLAGGTAGSTAAAFRFNRLAADERDARAAADRRAAEARAVVDFFVNDMLAEASPERARGRTATVRDVLARAEAAIAGRFSGQPLVEASIRQTMAETYLALDDVDRAEAHARRAVELKSRHLGPEHPETLRATYTLARVLTGSALRTQPAALRRREGRSLLEWLLVAQRRVLGPEHLDTAYTMNALGHTHHLATDVRPEEREALFERAAAIMGRELGPDHPDTLSTRLGIASVLRIRGRFAEAEAHFRAAYEGRLRVMGPDHPAVANTQARLARIIGIQGRWEEARGLYEEAIEAGRRLLGAEHAKTLEMTGELADLLARQGKSAEARSLLEQILAIRRRVRGPLDEETLSTAASLAGMLLVEGRREDALALVERVTGPSGPSGTKLPPALLNAVAWFQVAPAEAEAHAPRRALPLAEAAVAAAPEVATYWNTLGVARYRAGDWAGAIAALEESSRLARGRDFGHDGFFLAMAHSRLGREDEARRLYDRSVAWMEGDEARGADRPVAVSERDKAIKAELVGFRAEAARLLGLPDPPAGRR